MVILFMAGCNKRGDKEAENKKIVTEALTEHLKNKFKDPDSVQIRNPVLYTTQFVFEDGVTRFNGQYGLCGEVNAKNSYGGYVGFRRFYSWLTVNPDGGIGDISSSVDNSKDKDYFAQRIKDLFEQGYKEVCENKEKPVK